MQCIDREILLISTEGAKLAQSLGTEQCATCQCTRHAYGHRSVRSLAVAVCGVSQYVLPLVQLSIGDIMSFGDGCSLGLDNPIHAVCYPSSSLYFPPLPLFPPSSASSGVRISLYSGPHLIQRGPLAPLVLFMANRSRAIAAAYSKPCRALALYPTLPSVQKELK